MSKALNVIHDTVIANSCSVALCTQFMRTVATTAAATIAQCIQYMTRVGWSVTTVTATNTVTVVTTITRCIHNVVMLLQAPLSSTNLRLRLLRGISVSCCRWGVTIQLLVRRFDHQAIGGDHEVPRGD